MPTSNLPANSSEQRISLRIALRRRVRLLEVARARLVRVLLLALAEADDEGRVAVLLLRALGDDGEGARLDDGDALDGAVRGEELRAAELAAVDAGALIHDASPVRSRVKRR